MKECREYQTKVYGVAYKYIQKTYIRTKDWIYLDEKQLRKYVQPKDKYT